MDDICTGWPDWIEVINRFDNESVAAALHDLRRDFGVVLRGSSGHQTAGGNWTLEVERSGSLSEETFRLEVTVDRRIRIEGGDTLGAIFGIYEVSHRFLGVDALWFWKDIEPPRLAKFDPEPQCIESGALAFRFRGWFINDEDLLGGWKSPAGERFLDWPSREATLANPPSEEADNYEYRLLQYYTPVVPPVTMEMVYEAALRSRANLVIPASFTDIMNEPEEDMIRAAVRRGLYVSQHHVEPLGVAHFAFETWWSRRGGAPAFSYRENPEEMRTCWRAYAAKWAEVAGDALIWQVGLRGRGDRALWSHDPEAREHAGKFIADALNDQMAIIRSVDSRENPPATLTLWLEGAELIATGKLRVPDGVICVFADHSMTQEMQQDFDMLPREAGKQRGFYYHIAVWPLGPHLVQGPPPEKLFRIVRSVAAKGDTAYAILNVANVREHTMGIAAWTEQVWRRERMDQEGFLRRWAGPELAPFYAEFLECIPQLRPEWRLYDGGLRYFIDRLIRHHAGAFPIDGFLVEELIEGRQETRAKIVAAAERLGELLEAVRASEAGIEARLRDFVRFNLVGQAIILRGLYRAAAGLLAEPPDYVGAMDALGGIEDGFREGERGKWKDWYRGEIKVGVSGLRDRIERLRDAR